MRQRTTLVVFPPGKPMERKNARAERMAAALSGWLEKRTRSQTDSLPYKTRSGTASGIQSETGNRARASPGQKRRSQETPSCLRETTKGNGCLEIHQKPFSSNDSRKACEQKICQHDDPRLLLFVFRWDSPLVRGDSCRQESPCARGVTSRKQTARR